MGTTLQDVAEMPVLAQNLLQMMGALVEHDAEDDVIRRTYGVRFKAETLDEETRSVEFVCSTDAIDSYDEIVEQDWDLDRYNRNPVVLYGHNRASGWFGGLSQSETLPIGHAEDTRIDGGQLVARLFFATAEANPFAENVWQSIRQKTLRAVSVGFRSNDIRQETHDGMDRVILSQNELFEISVVPLPANPEATIRSADGTKHSGIREHHRAQLQRLIAKQSKAQEPQPATRGQKQTPTETDMDPKEIQEKYEALAAERDELQTKLNSALEQLKESAEANQELSDERDELTEKLAEVSSERDSAVSERDAVTVERDELKAKADAAELEVAKNVVASFVGVKATKAEEGVLLEDYQRLGRDEFERRMGLRADLPHTQQVTKPETDPENSASKGGNAGARLVNKAKAEAEKATRS